VNTATIRAPGFELTLSVLTYPDSTAALLIDYQLGRYKHTTYHEYETVSKAGLAMNMFAYPFIFNNKYTFI